MAADKLTPLAEFRLAWRFTGRRHALADPTTLARLTPMDADGSVSAAVEAARRCQGMVGVPATFRSDDPPGAVRRQLQNLPVDVATGVVLSWDAATALITDWATFVSHWDDFCYPASDDVTIWARDEDWTLCYHHYEVFQFWAGDAALPVRATGSGAADTLRP